MVPSSPVCCAKVRDAAVPGTSTKFGIIGRAVFILAALCRRRSVTAAPANVELQLQLRTWLQTTDRWGPGEQPLLPFQPNSTRWPSPPPPSCVSTSGACLPEPYNASRLNMGDWRVRIDTVAGLAPGSQVSLQVFWRRRDSFPERKGLILQKHAAAEDGQRAPQADVAMDVHVDVVSVTNDCALLSFRIPPHKAPGNVSLYLYPMAFYEYGEFEGTLNNHYLNCSEPRASCVGPASPIGDNQDPCAIKIRADGAVATAIENRPNPPGSSEGGLAHGDPTLSFPGIMPLERTATAIEKENLFAGKRQRLLAFLEPRENPVRFVDEPQLPATWARSGEVRSLLAAARPGEFFTFQIGIHAPISKVTAVTLDFAPLTPSDESSDSSSANATAIPAAAFTCFNLMGIDETGAAFRKIFSLASGRTSVLWVGVQLPPTTTIVGRYSSSLRLYADGDDAIPLQLELDISGALAHHSGDDQVYNMGRLRWLNSDLCIDDTIPAPFAAVTLDDNHDADKDAEIVLNLVNKRIVIGRNGLPHQAIVSRPVARYGRNITQDVPIFSSLGAPTFSFADSTGMTVPMKVVRNASIIGRSARRVSWSSCWIGGGMNATLIGSLDFDSYATFKLHLRPQRASVQLGSMNFSFGPTATIARFMCGLGTDATKLKPLNWSWNHTHPQGNNRVWIGTPAAGVYFHMRGPEPIWESPYTSVPYIPSSWSAGKGGARVTATGAVTAFAGAQSINASSRTQFIFDLAFTPSKLLDLKSHYEQRYLQIGYGVPYTSPENVSKMGATVATLHQGIQGVHNGTMINPYINYPFVPGVVEFMNNFTQQSAAKRIAVKFYYTLRELSSHAAELFAFKSLQGEILAPGHEDGSCAISTSNGGHAANTCGDQFLQEHLSNGYASCWQQPLSNGEVDAAVCDKGVGRMFNYYIEGLHWSISQPPHMSGVYFDGISFDRRSMQRVRKVIDRGAAVAGRGHALIDLHTGNFGHENSPSTTQYLSHFPYVDSAWNGEAFDFDTMDPAFYLVAVSGLIHGITADRLGGADSIRGMLFATYRRNGPDASSIWNFWDACFINRTELIGWWEEDAPVRAVVIANATTPAGQVVSNIGNEGNWSGPYTGYFSGCAGPLGTQAPCRAERTLEAAEHACDKMPFEECGGVTREAGKYQLRRGPVLAHIAQSTERSWARNCSREPRSCPAQCGKDDVLVSSYVEFGVRTIIVVASWCSSQQLVTLQYDWSALGLSSTRAYVRQPGVAHVQLERSWRRGETNFTLVISAGVMKGAMLVLSN